MKKGKICCKLKRILITIICVITLAFSMPVRAKADVILNFINLLLQIPDSIMWVGNRYIVGTDATTSVKLDFKGWSGKGSIYNFEISPYNIFTSGTEVQESSNFVLKDVEEQLQNVPSQAIKTKIIKQEIGGEEIEYTINEYPVTIDESLKKYLNGYSESAIEYDGDEYGNVARIQIAESLGYGYMEENNHIVKVRTEKAGIEDSTKIRLGLFDVNFFRNYKVTDENGLIVSSNVLTSVVGNVYKNLRNLCIILMMLVLLYIGIKIIVSTASSDQSKYKKMLVDWLVGLCLLFVMHYIMSFFMNMNTIILNMLNNDEGDSYYIGIAELEDDFTWSENKTSTWLELAMGKNPDSYTSNEGKQKFFENKVIVQSEDSNTKGFKVDQTGHITLNPNECIMYRNRTGDMIDFSKWGNNGDFYLSARIINSSNDNEKFADKAIYKANLMEFTRTMSSFALTNPKNVILFANGKMQNSEPHEDSDETNFWGALGYSVLYLTLVVETVMFIIIYLKRVLQLSMLTMIAPLVAFMYPLDKIGDGAAQSYNGWLKDYMFNVLIQPLHLLLYSIFIGAASQLFQKNLIYALAVYAFMIPAEKYFKKIFGFDKASGSPPGTFGGALGGAMAMRGFDKITGLGPKGPKSGSGGSGDSGKSSVKVKKKKLSDSLPSGSSRPSPTSSGSEGMAGLTGSGSGSRSGRGAGGGLGSRTLPSNNANPTDSRPSPTAGTDGSKSIWGRGRGLVHNALKRPISRALTGGKYDHLKNVGAGNAFKAIAGTAGRRTARALLTAGIATAGAMSGAATAIATGDVNNLYKGVATGLATGWNRGKQLSDWGADKVGSFVANRSADLANDSKENGNSGYFNQYRYDQAMEAFKDQELTDEQAATLATYAPYVDFNGNMDLLKAYVEADKVEEGSGLTGDEKIKSVTDIVSDAQRFGDLSKDSNRQAFMNAHLAEVSEDVDEEAIRNSIEHDAIEERARQNKEAAEANREAELEQMNQEMDKKIARARQAGNDRRAIQLETQRRRKADEINAEKVLDLNTARAQLENEAIENARQANEERARVKIAERLNKTEKAQKEVRKNTF